MINTKITLQNLHQRFPNMSLDDLFAILECIKEDFPITTWTDYTPGKILEPVLY